MPVPARIIESRISRSERMSSSRRNRQFRVYWSPRVRYSYEFAGARYESNSITSTTWESTDREAAEREIAPFRPGADVVAMVNPRQPAKAVLKTGGSGALIAMLGAGGLIWLALWSGIGISMGRRRRRAF
jgi:hypothetical protein